MITELEFILTAYLGEPLRIRGNGESQWPCPHCGHERFHTLPWNPNFKHRAKCWRCDFRGDAADMLKEFHPGEPWSERKHRLAHLHEEWLTAHSSGDRGCTERPDEAVAAAVAELFANLSDYPPPSFKAAGSAGLWAVVLACDIADRHRVSLRQIAVVSAKVLLRAKSNPDPIKKGGQ